MDSTAWLDEREIRAWRGFHAIRGALMAHLTRELARETGLTEADYAILAVVSEAPGHRMRARDLAIELGWERSRLSHQVSRMESRGSVRREPCAHDSRGFDLVVTPAGLEVVRAAAPHHIAEVRHCFIDLLSAEQLEVLGDIAERVTEHLATEHCRGTPAADETESSSSCADPTG